MNLILEALFILAVAADTILTYKVIAGGKGVEVGWFMRHVIDRPAAAIAITMLAVGVLLLWLNFVHMVWMLIPAIIYMARLCWKNWKVIND